jgi:hypothetical protein
VLRILIIIIFYTLQEILEYIVELDHLYLAKKKNNLLLKELVNQSWLYQIQAKKKHSKHLSLIRSLVLPHLKVYLYIITLLSLYIY